MLLEGGEALVEQVRAYAKETNLPYTAEVTAEGVKVTAEGIPGHSAYPEGRRNAIGMMLCGAFPMVYLIRKYLAKPLAKIGGAVGLSSDATAGLLAASANVLALLSMVKDLKARDKVICMAFAVCCAFLFGDHLSFTANFQPSLIVPVLLGKLAAGICAIAFAHVLAVKKAEELEAADLAVETKA